MMQATLSSLQIEDQVLDIVVRERENSLSEREWAFRLAGHGLAIKNVSGRQVLTKLPQGMELGVLPSDLA